MLKVTRFESFNDSKKVLDDVNYFLYTNNWELNEVHIQFVTTSIGTVRILHEAFVTHSAH